MDGFGDNFVPSDPAPDAAEVDPAAEFLAREQDQLAGLEDEIAPAVQMQVPAAPKPEEKPGYGNSSGLFGGTYDLELENFEMLGANEDYPESTPVFDEKPFEGSPFPQEAEAGAWPESPFPPPLQSDQESEVAVPQAVEEQSETATVFQVPAEVGEPDGSHCQDWEAAPTEGLSDDHFTPTPPPAAAASTAPSSAARQPTPPPVREEPEKIRIWREQQMKRLEEKDAAEEKEKEELQERAKKELEDWYKQHHEQVTKTRQANRSAEKELVADTGKIEPGTEWERIVKLCDFNPKTSKSSRDISRMRSILLQVKQNPPVKA